MSLFFAPAAVESAHCAESDPWQPRAVLTVLRGNSFSDYLRGIPHGLVVLEISRNPPVYFRRFARVPHELEAIIDGCVIVG